MKKEKLDEELGRLDEDIVEEADKVRQSFAEGAPKRKKPIIMITSVFVAVAAAVTGVVVIPKVIGNNTIPAVETTAAVSETTPPEVTGGVSVLDGEDDPKAAFSRERRRSDIVSEVKPLSALGDNIAGDSGFSIKLSKDVSADELKNRIRLSPQSEFTLTRENDGSYLLKTNKSFEKGSLVKLAVADAQGDICDSWAFRTAEDFAVYSTYPSNDSNYVPVDSGIEIQFTCAPSDEDPSGYFNITPAVNGRFDVKNNTLYFVPDDAFMPATTYTVTIKAGIRAADGRALESGTSFRFRTSEYSDAGNYMFTSGSMSGFSETFLKGDPACVEIHCSGELRSKQFETHLYRFAGSDAYFDALKAKSEEKFDFASLPEGTVTEVFKSSEVPFSRESGRAVYVILPDDLEDGYYVAEINAGAEGEPGYNLDYFVQITDISAYTLSLGDENVLFVNDAGTGLPASGADITITSGSSTYTGTVGDDGLAYVKTDGNCALAMLDIKAGAKRYIDCIMLSGAENMKYEDMYYTYLFTDREAYLPNDTVNVWGVIVPRTRGTALPDDLKLVFGSEEKSVTPAADGTFTAKFSFKNHAENWWELVELRTENTVLCNHGFSIRDYIKPTYIFDLEVPEYVIMPQTDPIPVKAAVTYYEGTPAECVLIESRNDRSEPGVLKTDAAGEATAKVWQTDHETWQVSSASVGFQLTGVENTYTYAWKYIPAFYRDRMLATDYNEKTRTLTLNVYDLDVSNKDKTDKFFEAYNDGEIDYDILKKGGATVPVHVVITRSWDEKKETGSYYDYVEKRTVKTYEYEYKRETVFDKTVDVVNGTARLTNLPTDPALGRYTVNFSYPDSLGQNVEDAIYGLGESEYGYGYTQFYDEFGEPMAYNSDSGKKMFSFEARTGSARYDDYGFYRSFSENDDITFKLKCSQTGFVPEGKLLLAVYKSDIVSYLIYDANGVDEFGYKATADCIPDIRYTGAYFDGKHIYSVNGGLLSYDPTERGIDLEVKQDRETYDAGDTAEITVTAADRNGRKISGATVLLSLFDEAAFAIEDQDAKPLETLYRISYYPMASTYVSYIQHIEGMNGGGEKGGGGPEAVRKDFRDTACFMSAETDANGIAHFTVTFPDNLTTWRATVLAIYQKDGGELLAGKTREPVVVTRPLFISPVVHQSFIEGDEVAVSAKCAGLPDDGVITIQLTGAGGVNETKTIKQQQTASFGKLAKGDYTVLFTAENGDAKDAVELPVTVTDTLLETDIYKGVDLPELSKSVKPTKWPIYLALFNKEYMLGTDILYDLLRYSGDSLDSRMAASFAAKELGYITEEDFIDEYAKETADGLAKLLRADEGNYCLTALMAAAAPKTISSAAKREFLDTLEYGNLGDKCIAYMGLAALGEPVQNDVRKLIADNTVTYVPSGIYLSAALAMCGDYEAAYDTYIKFVPEIVINDSDPKAITAYVANEKGEPNQLLTKSALITASILDLPEAEYFARYLLNSKPDYSSYALELALYVKNFVPKSKSEASFSYTLNGKTETVTLNRHYPTLLQLTEEQFANANFAVQSGEIYVLADYVGRVNENDTAPTIKVTKRLSGSMAVGETVTVTIQTEPYCAVYDVVPSCGRLSGSQHGQLVRLFTDKFGKATYKFTVNIEGSYVVESPAAYDYINGRWGIGERSSIEIGSGNEAM